MSRFPHLAHTTRANETDELVSLGDNPTGAKLLRREGAVQLPQRLPENLPSGKPLQSCIIGPNSAIGSQAEGQPCCAVIHPDGLSAPERGWVCCSDNICGAPPTLVFSDTQSVAVHTHCKPRSMPELGAENHGHNHSRAVQVGSLAVRGATNASDIIGTSSR